MESEKSVFTNKMSEIWRKMQVISITDISNYIFYQFVIWFQNSVVFSNSRVRKSTFDLKIVQFLSMYEI